MKIIFGLGNPGSEYTGTRHNVGFMAVNKIAKDHNVTFAEKIKFKASIAEITHEGEKALLVKPATFYNNVSESARTLIDFYKLNPSQDFLVIHDDLALPFGTIRVRKKGSDAGNNGIKSLNALIGSDFNRFRVGINIVNRRQDDSSFVLSHFTSVEKVDLKENITPTLARLVDDFLSSRMVETSVSTLSR